MLHTLDSSALGLIDSQAAGDVVRWQDTTLKPHVPVKFSSADGFPRDHTAVKCYVIRNDYVIIYASRHLFQNLAHCISSY